MLPAPAIRPQADGPGLPQPPTAPMQFKRRIEYEWELSPLQLTRLQDGTGVAVESPSFYGALEDYQLEWRVQLSVGPLAALSEFASPNIYGARKYVNALLKLVSMEKHEDGGGRVVTDVGVRFMFQLRFQNWAANRALGTTTTKRFFAGFIHGTDSLCTIEHFTANTTFTRNVKLYCALGIQDATKVEHKRSTSDVLNDYVANRQLQSLTNSLESLLNDYSSADITLRVGEEVMHAHKIILSARSRVFAAMFDCDMEEARNHKVEIEDFDPEIVRAMLKYIYCGDIALAKEKPYELIRIADKYELLELKDECEKFIVPLLTVENVSEALMCVYEHNLKASWPEIKNFVIRNQQTISQVDSLKDVVQKYPTILFDLYLSE